MNQNDAHVTFNNVNIVIILHFLCTKKFSYFFLIFKLLIVKIITYFSDNRIFKRRKPKAIYQLR